MGGDAQAAAAQRVKAIGDNVNEIGANISNYQLQTMEQLKTMHAALNAMQAQMDDDAVKKLQNEKHVMSQQYETKIATLEQELRDVKESVSDKDALISEQREKIKEMAAKQAYGQKMNALKDEIMDSMESGFESLRSANKQKRKSGMDDEKIMD